MQQRIPARLGRIPWADLTTDERDVVLAAAESLTRQARARHLAGRPPKRRAGPDTIRKQAIVRYYLVDIRAEAARPDPTDRAIDKLVADMHAQRVEKLVAQKEAEDALRAEVGVTP